MRGSRFGFGRLALVLTLSVGAFVRSVTGAPVAPWDPAYPRAQFFIVHIVDISGEVVNRHHLQAWLADPCGRLAYCGPDTSWSDVPDLTVRSSKHDTWVELAAHRPTMGTWRLMVMVPAKRRAVLTVGSHLGPSGGSYVLNGSDQPALWNLQLSPDRIVAVPDTSGTKRPE